MRSAWKDEKKTHQTMAFIRQIQLTNRLGYRVREQTSLVIKKKYIEEHKLRSR